MTPDDPAPSGQGGVFRAYAEDRDLDAVKRIWREVGWTTSDDDAAFVGDFFRAGRARVWERDGVAEAAAHIVPGRIRHLDQDLSLSAVTAVTVSHLARRQGAARRLLAQMLAEDADRGVQVSALGMFDQGFYEQLGFGTGAYEHLFSFDPAALDVPRQPRPPVRVTRDDWPEVHGCLVARRRSHGGVCLDDPLVVKAELGWHDPAFGLGYRDDSGRLTHFVFGAAKGEHGPYEPNWLAYRDVDELLELLALLRTLADQVHEVKLLEPPELQLQDLIRTPLREARRARGNPFQQSVAWWQLRILDLPATLAAVQLDTEPLTFNLALHDPLHSHLDADTRTGGTGGTAGSYVVTLGGQSGCEAGSSSALPTLRCGIGPFSRLLFGVRSATVLAATTDLEAEPSLLRALDRSVRVPVPHLAWDF